MADIAASDVTYTLQAGSAKSCPSDPRFEGVFKVEFGDGSLTYPSGGIPLTKGKLGCPGNIDSLEILDAANADGYVYKWDRANNKILIYEVPAGDGEAAAAAPLDALGSAPAATDLYVKVVGW